MNVVAVRAILVSSAAVVDHACISCLFIQHWHIHHTDALENTKYTSPGLSLTLRLKFDSEAFVLIYVHGRMALLIAVMTVFWRSGISATDRVSSSLLVGT